ncbi:MAG: carboxymuconolactone decarboxylase family protein [Desulfovibrio sp.]|nr:carboxymuconolactone decarboxylase family protein [Desulfovibrio sp.]
MDRIKAAEKNIGTWLETTATRLSDTDPELAAIRDRLVFGEILANSSLTPKQQIITIIVALTTNRLHDNLSGAFQAALKIGAEPVELRETLYQCAPYIGFPRVEEALKILNGILQKQGARLPLPDQGTVDEETRLQRGVDLQYQIFGKEHIQPMRENAPADQKELLANYLSAFCFGDTYSRKVLDLKMRELITFAAIVSLGGCDPQAAAHAKANISVGNNKRQLVDALTIMLPINGFPRTLNGLNCVNKAIPEETAK